MGRREKKSNDICHGDILCLFKMNCSNFRTLVANIKGPQVKAFLESLRKERKAS